MRGRAGKIAIMIALCACLLGLLPGRGVREARFPDISVAQAFERKAPRSLPVRNGFIGRRSDPGGCIRRH